MKHTTASTIATVLCDIIFLIKGSKKPFFFIFIP